MRETYNSGVTPQQKLVTVNNKFGNSGIKSQQGTSRIIYDSLATGTNTTFRFFEDSASRNFPFTNTGSDGNKLGVGDTMVIESVEFLLIDVDNTTGQIVASTSLVNYGFGASSSNYLTSIFDFEIANNKVIKKLTLTEGSSFYSKNTSTQSTDIELETQIVLPPLLPYILELRIPEQIPAAFIAGATRYVQAQIIGTGGIIAPRTTF